MESLIKASENYQAVAKMEEINLKNEFIWNEFMRKITVWDYHCITREHYLSLSSNENEAMIKKFYYEMKNCSSGKKFIIFVFFVRNGAN